jgi:hypothetical protein
LKCDGLLVLRQEPQNLLQAAPVLDFPFFQLKDTDKNTGKRHGVAHAQRHSPATFPPHKKPPPSPPGAVSR